MNRKERRAQGKANWKAHQKKIKTARKIQTQLMKDLQQYTGKEVTPELEKEIATTITKSLNEMERRTGITLAKKGSEPVSPEDPNTIVTDTLPSTGD